MKKKVFNVEFGFVLKIIIQSNCCFVIKQNNGSKSKINFFFVRSFLIFFMPSYIHKEFCFILISDVGVFDVAVVVDGDNDCDIDCCLVIDGEIKT